MGALPCVGGSVAWKACCVGCGPQENRLNAKTQRSKDAEILNEVTIAVDGYENKKPAHYTWTWIYFEGGCPTIRLRYMVSMARR